MLFILLFILIAHLGAGMVYARQRYAEIEYRNSNAADTRQTKAELEAQYAEFSLLPSKKEHRAGCGGLPFSSASSIAQWCDCGLMSSRNRRANAVKDKIANRDYFGGPRPAVDNPIFKPIIAWPIYGAADWVKGGTVKKANPNTIAQLEMDNNLFAELEELK